MSIHCCSGLGQSRTCYQECGCHLMNFRNIVSCLLPHRLIPLPCHIATKCLLTGICHFRYHRNTHSLELSRTLWKLELCVLRQGWTLCKHCALSSFSILDTLHQRSIQLFAENWLNSFPIFTMVEPVDL